MFAFIYQIPYISPALRGQCKNLKHGTFAKLFFSHVKGLGETWLKNDWYIIPIGRELTWAEQRASDLGISMPKDSASPIYIPQSHTAP